MKDKTFLKILLVILVIALTVGAVYFFKVYLPEKQKKAELEQLVKEYFAEKLKTYEKENARYDDYEVDVAFLGDSLTDGYDLAKYYPQYLTANRGIGGETSHGLEERLEVSLFDLKPKVAVILIGGNNLDTMFENYENMLVKIKSTLPDTKVILVSLTAMGGDWGHKNQIATYNNVKIKKLAAKYDFTFVDLFTPLFNEATGEIYSEYTSDGAHLTHEGYTVFTETLTPYIDEALGR